MLSRRRLYYAYIVILDTKTIQKFSFIGLIQEISELFTAAGMAQLSQRLRLNLAYTLSGTKTIPKIFPYRSNSRNL